MTNLWSLVDAVAAQLAQSQHVEKFRDGIKPVPSIPGDGFTVNSIHELLVSYSMLQCQPLILGMRAPGLPEFEPLYTASEDVREWLDSAERIAFAFTDLIEFLRSRLPGYPGLLVPDLVAGATRVRHDGFWDTRVPWLAEVRRVGLQFQNRPDMPPRALQLPDGGASFYQAVSELIRELRQTSAWARFEAAARELDAPARAAAKELRRRYREATQDDRVAAVAGRNGM